MITDLALGLVCCIVSVVCFGSMFVPIHFVETRDGFFVMYIQCAVSFIVGLILEAVLNFPKMEPLAMVGGIIWATGNITAIPIVNAIGMGLGMLIWTSIQILVGWATGRFGWFGLEEELPTENAWSIAGVVLSVVSGFIFAFVRPVSEEKEMAEASPSEQGTRKSSYATPPMTPVVPMTKYESFESLNGIQWQASIDEATPLLQASLKLQNEGFGCCHFCTKHKHKIMAVFLSIFAGLMYGELMTPMTYLQQRNGTASYDELGLNNSFSFFCGTFGAGSVYFVLYCIIKGNKPYINPKSVIPGIFYGLLWSIAMTAWFISNGKLSHSVAYPINSRLPALVGTVWSVFAFREIQGVRNYILLIFAIIVALVGVILIALAA